MLFGTGHVITRVYCQASHSSIRGKEDDLCQRVTTQFDRWGTRQPNPTEIRAVLRTAEYFDSYYRLTHRELLNIW